MSRPRHRLSSPKKGLPLGPPPPKATPPPQLPLPGLQRRLHTRHHRLPLVLAASSPRAASAQGERGDGVLASPSTFSPQAPAPSRPCLRCPRPTPGRRGHGRCAPPCGPSPLKLGRGIDSPWPPPSFPPDPDRRRALGHRRGPPPAPSAPPPLFCVGRRKKGAILPLSPCTFPFSIKSPSTLWPFHKINPPFYYISKYTLPPYKLNSK